MGCFDEGDVGLTASSFVDPESILRVDHGCPPTPAQATAAFAAVETYVTQVFNAVCALTSRKAALAEKRSHNDAKAATVVAAAAAAASAAAAAAELRAGKGGGGQGSRTAAKRQVVEIEVSDSERDDSDDLVDGLRKRIKTFLRSIPAEVAQKAIGVLGLNPPNGKATARECKEMLIQHFYPDQEPMFYDRNDDD